CARASACGRREFSQYRAHGVADGPLGILHIAATELFLGPSVPDRAVVAGIEHIDRQGAFTVLADVHIAAPVPTTPPVPVAPARAEVGIRIRVDIGTLLRADREINREVGSSRIGSEHVAFGGQLCLDCILGPLHDEWVARPVGAMMLTRHQRVGVVVGEGRTPVVVAPNLYSRTSGGEYGDSQRACRLEWVKCAVPGNSPANVHTSLLCCG